MNMKKILAGVLFIFVASNPLASQTFSPNQPVLLRRYREGEKLTYLMKGVNEQRHYEIQADGIVKKDSAGNFYEEYRWSNLISDNQKVAFPPASLDFRQEITLDPNRNPAMPNLSQVAPSLIGPITDFMTLYADLWLAVKTGQLAHAGDHFYFKHGTPNSWADGNYVLIGEDSIDFDLSLKDVNRSDNTATIIIRHLPPDKPEIQLPADWMRTPVADTANNWVQVQKSEGGKYLAAVGKETFSVELKLSLDDGKILSGSLDNTVAEIERECTDVALTECSGSKPHSIKRRIEIILSH